MKGRKILALALSVFASCAFLFSACDDGSQTNTAKRFGQFGYNGKYLTAFTTKDITASEAKGILSTNMNENFVQEDSSVSFASVIYTAVEGEEETVTYMVEKYAGCTITTKYYVEGNEEQSEKIDEIRGTDFKNMLQENFFAPFSQVVARYLICYPGVIDEMEALNEEFKNSKEGEIAPFRNVFSYHTDVEGNFVLQIRDFSEIPSSIGGGVGCSYRQDSEILFDTENKITKWQTSLGLYTATPQGTMKQGYILEIDFDWIVKE
ncbi:MAG: hypothetical protein IJ308_05365 [Clostridia bacterium]|nr:hypothetical protein [Clostridia bacterium]